MRKRRGWLLASLAVLLAASGGGYVVLAGPQEDSGRSGDRRADGLPPATAPVKRGDLSSGLQVEGTEAAPGKPVLTLTGTRRSVRFAVDVAKAGSVKTGDKVTVDLPGGGTAGGTIESVGSTADPDDPPGGGGGGGGGDKPKVEVAVALDDAAGAKGPDRSPVTVRLTGETRTGVLSVPVNSLLALSGGGFGVQVVEDGALRDVRVELGMFGQGRVEVKGGALKEGMNVGVPGT